MPLCLREVVSASLVSAFAIVLRRSGDSKGADMALGEVTSCCEGERSDLRTTSSSSSVAVSALSLLFDFLILNGFGPGLGSIPAINSRIEMKCTAPILDRHNPTAQTVNATSFKYVSQSSYTSSQESEHNAENT